MRNKKILASTLFFLVGLLSVAQGPPPPPPMPPPPPGLPIDSGIVMLFIAALALGVYKLHTSKHRV